MKELENYRLWKELLKLNEDGVLPDPISLDELLRLLSPEAKEEWDELLASCKPSPVAQAAGLTNLDILQYLLQKAVITRDAGSKEEENELLSLHMQVTLLGTGKEIDRYNLSPRKVRCISRGYRYDRMEKWEILQKTISAVKEKYASDRQAFPEDLSNEALEMLKDEPEAAHLIIGKTYTLLDILPDVPFSDGKNSHIGLVFLKELHSAPKDYLDYPDGGFHSSLFEEVEPVSVEDRIKHHDEFISMNLIQ